MWDELLEEAIKSQKSCGYKYYVLGNFPLSITNNVFKTLALLCFA